MTLAHLPSASAAPCEVDLAALARARGEVREVAGNTPFLLDDPSCCWLVLGGTVDGFLVQLDAAGTPTGTRHHTFRAGQGDMLFGLDPAVASFPVALLAAGTVGTQVARFRIEEIAALAADGSVDAGLAARLERWVVLLSQGMSRLVLPHPRIDLIVAAGDHVAIEAWRRAGCNRGVAWAGFTGAIPHFLDSEPFTESADGALLPISPASWAMVDDACEATLFDTATVLRDGRWWPSLQALHRVVLSDLPVQMRIAAVDEINRQLARDEADQAAAENALAQLAEPLAKGGRRTAPPIDSDEPLLRAAAAVAADLGVALVLPPSARKDSGRTASLAEIARANRLRTRSIVLEDGWWRDDVGSFLLQRAQDGRWVAVLRRHARFGRGGYELFDPAAGTTTRLDPAAAASLAGAAVQFYAPLPLRRLRARDLGGSVLRAAPHDVFALLLLALIGGLLNMATPIGLSYLVDTIIPGHELPALAEMGVVLVLVAAGMMTVRVGAQIATTRMDGRSGTRLQAAVMDRLLRLPVGFFRDFNAGDLAKRALAIRVIEQAIGGTVIGSLLNGLFALLSFALMAVYSGRLALVAAGLILLLALVTLALGLVRVRREREVMATTGATAGLLLQIASGIAKLRLAAAEERAFLRWARLYGKFSGARFGAQQVNTLLAAISAAYAPLAMGVVFAVVYAGGAGAGTGAAQNPMALGALLAFLAAFSGALAGMTGLAAAFVQLAALRPVYAYAAPILEAVPEVDEARSDPGLLSGAIEIAHVDFAYAGASSNVFDDFSLSIGAGEYVALVGPSGCGKSTFLRLLLGFEQPSNGAVMFDGHDLRGLDVQAVRRQFGVVLQEGRLMPGSLLDNILGPHMHLSEDDAWEAARRVGLNEDLAQMPMGMQTVISDGGGSLSGGQVQRVLLARAVVAKPRFLLLDEATSALDNRTQAIVTESLDRLSATRIVIAHRLSTVINADRIVVLRDGAVAEIGPYAELMERGGFFRELALRQLTETES